MDYKKIIKMLLIHEDMKQNDLVDNTGYNKQKISRLLNDDSITDVNTLIRLLNACNADLVVKYKDKEYKVDKVK